MTASSITLHLLYGPNSGYIVVFVVAIFLAIRSCFADVFIDESESPASEEEKREWGWKATKVTRPIMVGAFLIMAAFAVWKMWQP